MHVIAKPRLAAFWSEHPDAEKPLLAWYKHARRARWGNFADVRRDYPHADKVGDLTVFNIGGNKYRLTAKIEFRLGIVFVDRVMTHEEYGRGDWRKE